MRALRSAGHLVPIRREGVHIEEMSDNALVAACATGDRAARAALFERHVDALHRFLSRMTATDAASLDDLVQTTFLRAFEAAGKFRGASQVRSWLFGIGLNVVRGYARGEIRRKAALASIGDQPVERTAGPPRLDERRLLQRLEVAIGALPHELRAAVVLVDVEGLRGVDAAHALGVPEGTLWRRLHEARAQLRVALEGVR